MTGTVRKAGDGWTIEHSYTAQETPERITVTWRVLASARSGAVAFAPELRDELEIRFVTDDRWEAYASGGYLMLTTEHEGAVSRTPVPCPRVRAGVETRYRHGRWEKLTKRAGWVAARRRPCSTSPR